MPTEPTHARLTQTSPDRSPLVAVGLIALAFFLHRWLIGRHVESTDNAYVQGEITRVASQLARVEKSWCATTSSGQGAVAGTPGRRRLKLAAERAQAALATREAELAQARSKLVQQGSLIAASAADVNASQATLGSRTDRP